MIESRPIFLRAHTEHQKKRKGKRHGRAAGNSEVESEIYSQRDEPKWPKYALLIDCETTIDERQALTFGFYRLCRREANGNYECVEEGIFHANDLEETDPEATAIL